METKLKHLDFIQGVVNRLSTNSFLLKGWSVILTSALFALSASDSEVSFVLLAFVPVLVFWGLDGYFLALERAYRRHFDRVRTMSAEEIDFTMDISDVHRGFSDWAGATFSKTLILFHGSLVTAVAVVMWLQF